MAKIGSYISFIKWNILHPSEILFLPKWITSYRKTALQTELLWSNFNVISFLEDKLSKNLDVLEFGSGGSTIFFSKRVKSVVSIEHDKTWFNEVKKIAPNNVKLFLKSKKDYISVKGKYDIVFVDGIRRLECTKKAVTLAKKGGLIIVDDANFKEKGLEPSKYLDSLGLKYDSFIGIKPNDLNIWETRVYFNK